ncbi:MAG: CDP-alcohol phosphatidyltransferase family protein [Pseudomonadota bacterium]
MALTAPGDACQVPLMPLSWIPNALTIARCGFAVLLLYATAKAGTVADAALATSSAEDFARLARLEQLWRQFALLAFVAGAFTDFGDGFLARRLNAQSRFGVWLDPIADKLLVGAALISLCIAIGGWLIILPAAAIIMRDVGMTIFRATPQGRSAVDVSGLAKWKTAVEMIAITGLLLPQALAPMTREPSGAADGPGLVVYGFAALLWVAAALSILTAASYVRASRRS